MCGTPAWSRLGSNKAKKCCVRRVISRQRWLYFKLYPVNSGWGKTTSVPNWIPCVNRARAEGRTAASQADVSTVNSLEQSWRTCNQAMTSPFTNTLLSATQAPLCPTASVLHNELMGIFSPPALVMKNSSSVFYCHTCACCCRDEGGGGSTSLKVFARMSLARVKGEFR